jgi:hypothetical protein
MRTAFGWVCFLLAILFALGLDVTVARVAWLGLPATIGLLGFLGFGTLSLLAGALAASLWGLERSAARPILCRLFAGTWMVYAPAVA